MKKHYCRNCGAPIAARAAYRNGLCTQCGIEYMLEWVHAMEEKSGPLYEIWKARWEAATGLTIKEE